MIRLLMTLLFFTAGFLLVAVPVFGQGGELVRERLVEELERTNEAINRARDIVISSNSPQGKIVYDKAVEVQAAALEHYRLGPGGGHWDMASKLTLQARLQAQEAIVIARESQQNETALLRRLERAQELVDQVKSLTSQSERGDFEAVLATTEKNLERAWEFYRQQQYRAALKLANQVERTAEKMLQAANRENQRDQNFERQLESAERFVEQVKEQTADCESQSALQLIDQAAQALESAQRYDADANREASVRALQQCRELGSQAARECSGDNNLQKRHERLVNQAEKLGDEIGAGDRSGRVLLEQAWSQLDLAYGYIQQGHMQAAIAALKAAQLSLDEVQRVVQHNSR